MKVKAGFWNCCQERPTKAVLFYDDNGAEVWHKACASCASTVSPNRVQEYKPTAKEKRGMALAAVSKGYIDDFDGTWIKRPDAELVARVRALKNLGRTDRWKNAVEACAVMMEADMKKGGDGIFDFLQGAVYINFQV